MNLHNDAVLANIIVKFTSRNYEDRASVVLYMNCLSRGIIDRFKLFAN